jgi:hypothetical protein
LWNELEASIDQLIENRYEENLFKSLKSLVQKRKLDSELEFTYERLRDVIANKDQLLSLKEKKNNVVQAVKSFLEIVEKIKNC